MSGTDHSIKPGFQPQPRMILVRPQMGENIGSAARAMWNFGLNRMCLVDPRDGWPNPAATALASGAAQVLDNVVVQDDLGAAIDDLHYVMATTARDRDLTKEVLSPKEAMIRAQTMIASGKKVGIIFGPERSGLENEDLAPVDVLVSVPVNPAFGSLNLAQCVLLLSYEWELSQGEPLPSQIAWGPADPASVGERTHLIEKLEERLDSIGFFWPEKKADAMRQSLHNMFARMTLSDIDVRTLHGVFRSLWRGEPFANKKSKTTVAPKMATILVKNYDDAIEYFVNAIGLELLEDTELTPEKRWVRVGQSGGLELLLAKASDDTQKENIGQQTGGRVGFFLTSNAFDADYERMKASGVNFQEDPRNEAYGKVVVFKDIYGNLWDLLEA